MSGLSLLKPGARVGLYGGSFNPAHEGHLEVATAALRRLQLDRVEWLLALQNPLKNQAEYQNYDARAERVRLFLAGHPRMGLSTLEAERGLTRSLDTLNDLNRRHPHLSFVWIMGADSWAGFHRWYGWKKIAERVPICVISRPEYDLAALTGPAARTYADRRISEVAAPALPGAMPPAWCFLPAVHNPLSATSLRMPSKDVV